MASSENKRRAAQMTTALMAWLPSSNASFKLTQAMRYLTQHGFGRWSAGQTIRNSPLFVANDFDASLPDEFRETSFALSSEGQALWERTRSRIDAGRLVIQTPTGDIVPRGRRQHVTRATRRKRKQERAAAALTPDPNFTAEAQEPTAKAQEPTAKAQEPTAKAQEPPAKAQKPTAKTQKPTAKAQEPTAEAQEPTAFVLEPDVPIATTSLAGFTRGADNLRRVRRLVRKLAGDGWVGAEILYPALRDEFGWGEVITKTKISSMLGMLSALGDVQRRKTGKGWEFRPGR